MRMNSALATFAAALVSFGAWNIRAEDAAKKPDESAKSSNGDLEAKFISTLTAATLSGRACGIKDARLGPDKEDSYNITSVAKQSEDHWLINAHIKYGQNNYDIPIPAQVKWAGDTAVLILDNISLGGTNTYSARVLIYNNTYAGTWSGGDHGGLVNGVITH